MFDLLKKKISGFVDKLGGKKKAEEEEKVPEPKKEKVVDKKVEKKAEPPKKKEKEEPAPKPKKEALEEKSAKPKEAPPKKGKGIPVPEKKKAEETPAPKPPEKKEEPKAEPKEEPKPAKKEPEKKKGLLERILPPKKKEEPKPSEKKAEPPVPEEKPPEPKEEPKEVEPAPEPEVKPEPPPKKEKAEKKEEVLRKKVKKGLLASVTETITGESEVREEEVVELLEELELGMLESDVALSVAEEIKEELRKRIVGSKVKRGQTAVFVRDSLKDILLGIFRETPGFEFSEKLKGEEKPYRVMVVGPNGAGKTTTIAKMVTLLQKSGYSVCVAASDTFRAAAVEQLVHHGNKLGITVVHGAYGSDPTSIAFDAVNYAKANGKDVVLIDTAGRQETNLNLLNQLKKMDRVIKPDLKIYVGESIAGNAMVEQISRFNSDLGLDGVILTKLDCDAKGGTVISVSRVAQLPILYVGVGQGYEDMKRFVAEEIVEEILS